MNGANPDSNPGRNSSLVSAIRGPIVMITIGALFLLDKFTRFQFGETWPVILIVLGVLALSGGSGRALRGGLSMGPQVGTNSPTNYPGYVPPVSVPTNNPPYTPPYNPNAPPPGARR